MNNKVPAALRIWFIIHFVIDILFAVPLFLFPVEFLSLFQWNPIDPLATRMVAAALFAIGIESWLGRNENLHTYVNMLNLKIIWSGSVLLAIALSIYNTPCSANIFKWLLLTTFFFFHILWFYWRITLSSLNK